MKKTADMVTQAAADRVKDALRSEILENLLAIYKLDYCKVGKSMPESIQGPCREMLSAATLAKLRYSMDRGPGSVEVMMKRYREVQRWFRRIVAAA